MNSDVVIGFLLALFSSILIGVSFILTKKGLLASSNGDGGSTSAKSYLRSPLWWLGLIFLGIGELSNFSAYIYAPAILVTPLGAVSVIVSAVLASIFLKDRLSTLGKLGCVQSIIGSTVIVLNSPEERKIEKIDEFVALVLKPGFLTYFFFVLVFTVVMIVKVVPKYGRRNILVYVSICSLVGSVSVMSCKFLGTSIAKAASGEPTFSNAAPYVSIVVVIVSILTQMNYLNKALDTFNTAVVTPIYYVIFTTSTIIASVILFQGFEKSNAGDIVSVLCGFLVIFFGVFLLSYDRVETRRASIHKSPNSFIPIESGAGEEDFIGGVLGADSSTADPTTVVVDDLRSRSTSKAGSLFNSILNPLSLGLINSMPGSARESNHRIQPELSFMLRPTTTNSNEGEDVLGEDFSPHPPLHQQRSGSSATPMPSSSLSQYPIVDDSPSGNSDIKAKAGNHRNFHQTAKRTPISQIFTGGLKGANDASSSNVGAGSEKIPLVDDMDLPPVLLARKSSPTNTSN